MTTKRHLYLLSIAFGLAFVGAIIFLSSKTETRQTKQMGIGWQMYQNTEFGFSIRYPSDVNLIDKTSFVQHEAELGAFSINPVFGRPALYICLEAARSSTPKCDHEVVITPEHKGHVVTEFSFGGFPRCRNDNDYPIDFGEEDGVQVQVCGDDEILSRAAVAEHNGYTYLLITNFGTTSAARGVSDRHNEILRSFQWGGSGV